MMCTFIFNKRESRMKKYIILSLILSSLVFSNNSGFIKNEGQLDNDVKYYAQLDGVNYFVKEDGVYLDFYKKHKIPNMDEVFKIGEVFKMQIEGSEDFDIKANRVISKNNYFIGPKENWKKNVPIYDEILLEGIQNNIDLRIYLDQKTPRYDFIVNPGADINNLSYNFSGIKSMEFSDLKVEMESEFAFLETSKLLAYQIIDGKRVVIDCKFYEKNGNISFQTEDYDKSKPLIIDPIVFSTYYGTDDEDEITVMEKVNDNEIIVAGFTKSNSFPTTEGVYQDFYNFETDAFISKIRVDGLVSEVVFSTYLGGTNEDKIKSLIINDDNDIVVTGTTNSQDFPTENAIQQIYSGDIDLFLTKLNSDGSQLINSTFYGGSSEDVVTKMVSDNSGNLYFVGYTNSNNFPTTNAYSSNPFGLTDGFLVSVDKNMNFVEFSTYFGGSGEDTIQSVAINNQEDIYICGATKSSDFDIQPGGFTGRPFDNSSNGGVDIFVSKLIDGTVLEINTYYGGLGDENAFDIFVPGSGDSFFIVGATDSEPVKPEDDGLIITNDTYSNVNSGEKDIIIAEFSEVFDQGFFDRQDLLKSTLLGGENNDIPSQIKTNINDNIVITGYTESQRFPTKTELGEDYNGGKDGFVAYLTTDLSELNFSEFIGASGDDKIVSIEFDEFNNFFYAGNTNSTDIDLSDNNFKGENNTNSGWIGRRVFGNLDLLSPDQEDTYCRSLTLPINWNLNNTIMNDENYTFNLINAEDNSIFTIDENFSGEKPYFWEITDDVPLGEFYFQIIHNSGLFKESTQTIKITEEPNIEGLQVLEGSLEPCIGENVTLSVNTVIDDEEYRFKWFKNNAEIENATQKDITIENIQKEDSGIYRSEVIGECKPNATSDGSEINVIDSTAVTEQSDSEITVLEDENLEIFVTAIGDNLEYQWFFDGNELLGENNSSLAIENISESDEGEYYCLVSGKCGKDVQSALINVAIDIDNNVDINNKRSSEISFNYLIPNQGNIKFSLDSKIAGNADLVIMNSIGQIVASQKIQLNIGEVRKEITNSEISSGLYLIHISSGSKFTSSKFVISK